jgi:hypothetical protein
MITATEITSGRSCRVGHFSCPIAASTPNRITAPRPIRMVAYHSGGIVSIAMRVTGHNPP